MIVYILLPPHWKIRFDSPVVFVFGVWWCRLHLAGRAQVVVVLDRPVLSVRVDARNDVR
jgi:hypothetical protein